MARQANAVHPAQNQARAGDTEMLSPHEIATLMVLSHPHPHLHPDVDPDDLNALVERQLVHLLEASASGCRPIRLTVAGLHLLQAMRGRHRADTAALLR